MIDLHLIAPERWAEIAGRARGLYSDIDDTLTDEGKLSRVAYSALTELRAAGMRIVLVTGRPLGWAEVLTAMFPIDAAVAENGAVAALPGGRRVYFDDEATRNEGARRKAAAAARVRTELPDVKAAGDQALREIDLAFDIDETGRLPEPLVARLQAILCEAGLTVTRSSIHMHGTYSAADKAKMAARVSEHLWHEPAMMLAERDLFVGDSPNDASAFAFFRHSIGVANVRAHEPSLRALGALPWAVTRARGGHGFAELVAALLPHKTP